MQKKRQGEQGGAFRGRKVGSGRICTRTDTWKGTGKVRCEGSGWNIQGRLSLVLELTESCLSVCLPGYHTVNICRKQDTALYFYCKCMLCALCVPGICRD